MIQITMQAIRKTTSQTAKNTIAQIKALLSKDRYFFLFAMSFLLVKLILMKDVTIYAITTAFADDQLMVHIAEKLLRLNWLGGYNHYTLAKGAFSPFFWRLESSSTLILFHGYRFSMRFPVTYF